MDGKVHFVGSFTVHSSDSLAILKVLTRVYQKVDNAIQRINHFPEDSKVCIVNTNPVDNDLYGG